MVYGIGSWTGRLCFSNLCQRTSHFRREDGLLSRVAVIALEMVPSKSENRKAPTFRLRLVFALLIFPGSYPPNIVSAHELNFCVRDGNRWTLMAINTNYSDEL